MFVSLIRSPGKQRAKIYNVTILMNINRAIQTSIITGEKLILANTEVTVSSNLLKDTEILFPIKKPNGTKTIEATIATGVKKIESGITVPGYTQAGTPVAYLTSGKRATAINADPPPNKIRPDNFLSHPGLKIASKRIIAAPSVTNANIGLMMAPSPTGSMSSNASNNLNNAAIQTIRIGTKNRRVATQPA